MRHGGTLNHRTLARTNNRAVAIALGLRGQFLFIATAIIVAGIAAMIIRLYRGDLSNIMTPKSTIVAPEYYVITTPHDDICDNVFDNWSASQNIKGFSESSRIKNGCISRQMGTGVDLDERGGL